MDGDEKMIGENAVDAVLALYAEVIPELERRHKAEKCFEAEITEWGRAAGAIKDLLRLAREYQEEIARLRRAAWECWRRDTMDSMEAEKLIGHPRPSKNDGWAHEQ